MFGPTGKGPSEKYDYDWNVQCFYTTGDKQPQIERCDEGVLLQIFCFISSEYPSNMEHTARWLLGMLVDGLSGNIEINNVKPLEENTDDRSKM